MAIPRKQITTDDILGEVQSSKFNDTIDGSISKQL